MKKLYSLILLICLGSVSYAQVEDCGNPSGPTPVNSYIGWSNGSGLHFSGTATVDTAHPSAIDILDTSTNHLYHLASGRGNILFDTAGSYVQVSGFLSGLVPIISVDFNIYGYDSVSPTLSLSISVDSGNTWAPLPLAYVTSFPVVSSHFIRLDTSGWSRAGSVSFNLIANPQGTWWDPTTYTPLNKVFFRFTQTANNHPFRIDDIQIQAVGLLSLDLLSFNAVTTEKNTLVSWRANSETDRELFVLEKSDDAIEFRAIAQQPAKGKGEFWYQYADQLNQDRTYYRLKMISDDKSIAYSKTVIVGGAGNDNALLQKIYPSPATDVAHVLLYHTKDENVSISLTDAKGSQLINQSIFFKQGINTYTLDVKNMPAGNYLLTVSNSEQKETKQILISK